MPWRTVKNNGRVTATGLAINHIKTMFYDTFKNFQPSVNAIAVFSNYIGR
jgi:hypothetical protein